MTSLMVRWGLDLLSKLSSASSLVVWIEGVCGAFPLFPLMSCARENIEPCLLTLGEGKSGVIGVREVIRPGVSVDGRRDTERSIESVGVCSCEGIRDSPRRDCTDP